jgi:DNA-binding transcriptional regulator YiaG
MNAAGEEVEAGRNYMDKEHIKEIRRRSGLTQEGFAHKLGVTHLTVGRWERGEHKPSPLAARKLWAIEDAQRRTVTRFAQILPDGIEKLPPYAINEVANVITVVFDKHGPKSCAEQSIEWGKRNKIKGTPGEIFLAWALRQ